MQVQMPLTPPEKSPGGKFASRYAAPMEGRVGMRLYKHKPDDSPLLIQRYYDNLLMKQGFERLSSCATPCPGQAQHSFAWHDALDPDHVLNYTAPDRPSFEVFYKSDALVILLVGAYSDYYLTIIKTVEGQFLDMKAIEAVRLLSSNGEPSPTPNNGTAAPTSALAPVSGATSILGGKVELVAPAVFGARLAQTKGVVVVQFSSDDNGCGFCVQSNPRFDTLSKAKSSEAEFFRVMWRPYLTAFDDELAVTYGIVGLPMFVTFKNGKIVRQVNGNYTAVQLGESLLRGVK